MIAEIFPRALVEQTLLARQHLVELVLERLDRERDPAHPAFDQPDLEFGMAVEPTRNHPVAQRRRVADREHRRDHRQRLFEPEPVPGDGVGIDRGIEMEVDRRARFRTHFEERGPVVAEEAGHPDAFGGIGQDEPLDPVVDAAPGFGVERGLVPERQVAHIEDALVRHLLVFHRGVVVDLDDRAG